MAGRGFLKHVRTDKGLVMSQADGTFGAVCVLRDLVVELERRMIDAGKTENAMALMHVIGLLESASHSINAARHIIASVMEETDQIHLRARSPQDTGTPEEQA